MENNIFYCYSFRLHCFLTSLKFSYEFVGKNQNTEVKYWTYKKSENLDNAISLYNEIKHKFN